MATATVQNRVRIGGAGFTLFTFAGQPIAFCDQVRHDSERLVAQPSFIQPMDEPYPVEIVIPPASTGGSLTLNMIELFGSGGHNSKIWDRLGANVGNGQTQPFGALNNAGQYNTSQYLSNLTAGVGPLAGAVDIVDIIIRQAQLDPTSLQVSKIIRPLSAGANAPSYTEDFMGCMITDIQDGETVAVGTKEIIKQITISYRYRLRNGVASQAFAMRDGVVGSITPRLV